MYDEPGKVIENINDKSYAVIENAGKTIGETAENAASEAVINTPDNTSEVYYRTMSKEDYDY